LEAVRRARAEVEALMAEHPGDSELKGAAGDVVDRISDWDRLINQALHETYEDEDAWETMLAGQIRYLMDVIDRTGAPVTDGAMQRFDDLQAEWRQRVSELEPIAERIGAVNEWAQDRQVPHVSVPGG
jgi:hypothetical protein